MIGFAEQRVFLSVSLFFNRVTSDVSRRVPPTLRPQQLEFQYSKVEMQMTTCIQRFASYVVFPSADIHVWFPPKRHPS